MINSPSSIFWRRFLDVNSRGWRPYALISCLCLLLYLPGIGSLPVIDRDEPMYAQSTKQMVKDKQYIQIRFGDQDRNKKPIGIYWLQAFFVKVSGITEQIWPYRLPSLLGVIVAALATFWAGKELFRPQAALIAALLLPCSLLLEFVGHQAITDAALLACVSVSQAALAGIYVRNNRSLDNSPAILAIFFWVALGCGILLKGPVILIVPLGTLLAIRWKEGEFTNLRGLGLWWGIPLCIAIVAPWIIAIQKATDGQFLRDSLGGDFLGKLVSVHEGHSAFPGFYFLTLPLSFWPGILFLPSALALAWRKGSRYTAFLLGWSIPLWLVLEIIPTKLPHYLLPVFPALALLCGEYCSSADKRPDGKRLMICGWIVAVFAAFAPLGALIGLEAFFWYTRSEGLYMPIFYLMVPALAFAVFALWKFSKGRRLELAAAAVILSIIVIPAIYRIILPAQKQCWITQTVGAKYHELISNHTFGMKPRLVSLGLHMPSMLFYCGRDTILTSDQHKAADIITINPAALVLVNKDYHEQFIKEMNSRNITVEAVDTVNGFNYDKWKFVTLKFFRRPRRGDYE